MRATKYRAASGDVAAIPLYKTPFQSSCVRICGGLRDAHREYQDYCCRSAAFKAKARLLNASCDVVTWKTVTMAQSRESKFFRSGTVSPVSVLMLNLQPKMCIPRMLQHNTQQQIRLHTDAHSPAVLVI